MALSNSEQNRYDIDERLTVDPQTAIQGPLELVSIKMERNDIESCTPQPLTAASPTQRSIFCAYWKTNARAISSQPSLSPISSEVEKRQSTQRRRIIHKTFSYTYDRDPFKYFGIYADEGTVSTADDDEDNDSMNSYELILQKNEVGVTENVRRRSRTCPSLSFARVGIDRAALDGIEKRTQSDTVLFAKTPSSLQRLSCLRKSRFSINADTNNSNSTLLNKGERKGEHCTSVSFDARIMVHLFEPPVEKWAPIGWSNWFGGGH